MTKKVNELSDGYRGEIQVMITSVNRGVTAKGAPYLSFTFQDQTGTIQAKYWNVNEEMLHMYTNGMVVSVTGDVLTHQKQIQFRVSKMEIVPQEEVDIHAYIQTADISKEELKKEIESYVMGMQNKVIQDVCVEVLKRFEDRLYDHPAAARNHHDFAGGLAYHIVGMLHVAQALCKLYPMLNMDVLYGGVLLHDIGKIIELSGPIATEYTTSGKLLGHISIMQAEVAQIALELGYEGCEEVMLLRHMILSHHGEYAYGSPVLPMIPEAEMLSLIDNIDARMNTMQKAYEHVEEGEFTQRVYALDNRMFYKQKG